MMKANYQDSLVKLVKKGKEKTVSSRKETKTSSCLAFMCERLPPTSVPSIFGSTESQQLAVQLVNATCTILCSIVLSQCISVSKFSGKFAEVSRLFSTAQQKKRTSSNTAIIV
jgi:hypothetical protein